MKYEILQSGTIEWLEDLINKFSKAGWTLVSYHPVWIDEGENWDGQVVMRIHR